MNNNAQVDYKFKISYILNFFKDMVSSSGDVEDKELSDRIKKVEEEQDTQYIEMLKKEIETHDVSKKRKTTRNSTKGTKNNDIVEENMKSINKEVKQDEEKEL